MSLECVLECSHLFSAGILEHMCLRYSMNKTDQNPHLCGAYILVRRWREVDKHEK